VIFEGPSGSWGAFGDSPFERPAVTRKKVYLHAGQLCAYAEPSEITTILGSCIAVCVFDPIRRAGGMNHYVLPMRAGEHASPRFGNVAIKMLVDRLANLGSHRRDLQAKLFGGAAMVGAARTSPGLGDQNIALAREMLTRERIPIVAEDVGGDRGRKLLFRSDDGVALVKKL
jgi:chemotaxis protein CheD